MVLKDKNMQTLNKKTRVDYIYVLLFRKKISRENNLNTINLFVHRYTMGRYEVNQPKYK